MEVKLILDEQIKALRALLDFIQQPDGMSNGPFHLKRSC
jgi:hypothetical protein